MSETEIKNPTYFEHIRHFFDDEDHACMFPRKWDFTNYPNLKMRAVDVFTSTEPPNPSMPKGRPKWSRARSNTFLNWMENEFPLGVPDFKQISPSAASRTRKNAANLGEEELSTLVKAFEGIMKLPRTNPNSYFALASIHYYPTSPGKDELYCEHHEMLYNPWHRAYINRFEDALRSIPGCENVTLPYWDITQAPPEFLFKPPFASYKLPIKIADGYPKDYETKRYPRAQIARELRDRRVTRIIDQAMNKPIWRDFTSHTGLGIEAAHDEGHLSIGPTLRKQDAASFDPIFWFFHCNWDRLWWEWQQRMSATTKWSFRTTILGDTRFLDHRLLNRLQPFGLKSNDVIDLGAMGIGYELSTPIALQGAKSIIFASTSATRPVRVKSESQASVRIKNINRAKINGSFDVVLKSGRKAIGKRGFFQPTHPDVCPGCKQRAEISFDFLVDLEDVVGKKLDFEIVVVGDGKKSDRIVPKKLIGAPTINIRLLMEET